MRYAVCYKNKPMMKGMALFLVYDEKPSTFSTTPVLNEATLWRDATTADIMRDQAPQPDDAHESGKVVGVDYKIERVLVQSEGPA